jgi:hypothetical protein
MNLIVLRDKADNAAIIGESSNVADGQNVLVFELGEYPL